MRGLSYHAVGSGPAVFLLHAFPLDHTMWSAQCDSLRHTYRLIAPDAFGFGESSLPASGWTCSDLAASVLGLADELDIPDFTLAGLSMGGYVAFEVWRQAPGRVRALVLADTRSRGDSPEEKQTRQTTADAVLRDGVEQFARTQASRLLRRTPDSRVLDRVQSIVRQARSESITNALKALAARRDFTDLLGSIACPTLVLTGDEDTLTPVRETQAWTRVIPGGRFVAVPDAGHLSNMENPGVFNTQLKEFLSGTVNG